MTNIEAVHALEKLWTEAGENRDWFKHSKMREVAVNLAMKLDDLEVARTEERPTIKSDRIKADDLLGAVARGWCHPKNEGKEFDADLAISIASEVNDLLLLGPPSPQVEPKP